MACVMTVAAHIEAAVARVVAAVAHIVTLAAHKVAAIAHTEAVALHAAVAILCTRPFKPAATTPEKMRSLLSSVEQ